jgi:membrane protease YdiL (CAAX protease family)
VVPLFLVGAVAALIYERHRSLLPAIVMHATFNALSLIAAAIAGSGP